MITFRQNRFKQERSINVLLLFGIRKNCPSVEWCQYTSNVIEVIVGIIGYHCHYQLHIKFYHILLSRLSMYVYIFIYLFIYCNPILFAICTSTFSKLCKRRYTVACRRVLSSAPLQLIGSRPLVAFGNKTCKLNLNN
jgi:hypothetical protein